MKTLVILAALLVAPVVQAACRQHLFDGVTSAGDPGAPCHTSGTQLVECDDFIGSNLQAKPDGSGPMCAGGPDSLQLDGAVLDAEQTCVATSGAAVRTIKKHVVMKFTPTTTEIVADDIQSVGSTALSGATTSVVPWDPVHEDPYRKTTMVRGVAGKEIDWLCITHFNVLAPKGTLYP